MAQSERARALIAQFSAETVRMGDLKKEAKTIKTDHALAMELWSSGAYYPRMLAVLILDKSTLDQSSIEALVADMAKQSDSERNRLSEWLLANQLMKNKRLAALIGNWEHHPSPTLRRLFWYQQARLRWTGRTPPDNTAHLMEALETRLASEVPEVQWTMNFCAGQIGVHEPQYRAQCIALGERVGLYSEEVAPRNCTPSYLPEFIRIEAGKREA